MLTIDGFLECRNLPRPNKLPGLRKQPGCMHCIQTQEIYVGFTDIGQTPNLAE